MRLLADEMLGKLARWLRLLGFDVAYVNRESDAEILAAAREESRLLLTRDVELSKRAASDPGSFLVRSHDPEAQVLEVLAGLGLAVELDRVMTRCSNCNGRLERADPERVRPLVPEGVRDRTAFYRCAGCGQIYWEGSHGPRIEEKAREFRERMGSGAQP